MRKHYRAMALLGAPVSLAVFLGCGGGASAAATAPTGSDIAPVASLRIAPAETVVLSIGDYASLAAQTLDSQGRPVAGPLVKWSSVIPTVATVSATGLVVALSTGSTEIVVSAAGKEARANVRVVARETVAPLVDLDFSKARTRAEALAMLTAAGGVVQKHHASSSQPHWATVDPLALIDFVQGQGLVMLQPKGTSVTPYFRFDGLGARPGLWQLVERKFSPGWTTDGEPGPGAGYKVDGIGWAGGNGSARIEMPVEHYNIPNGFIPTPGDGSHAPMVGVPSGQNVHLSGGRVGDEWTGTRFHRYVMHYRAEGRRGVFLTFLDGRMLADATVTYVSMDAPLVNRSSAGMNFNRIRYRDQSITIRRIIILDSRANPDPWGLRPR